MRWRNLFRTGVLAIVLVLTVLFTVLYFVQWMMNDAVVWLRGMVLIAALTGLFLGIGQLVRLVEYLRNTAGAVAEDDPDLSQGPLGPCLGHATTEEAQIALDRNEARAETLASRYWMRKYGHASQHEAKARIGRYRLKDGTEILVQQEGASVRLCMPEELLKF